MAIEFAPSFCRRARTRLLALVGMSALFGVAMAQQELVTTGSVIPLQHSKSASTPYTAGASAPAVAPDFADQGITDDDIPF